MKTTDKLMLIAFCIGAAVAGGLFWLWSGLPWWAYLIVGLLTASGVYPELVKQKAAENIANKDVTKD